MESHALDPSLPGVRQLQDWIRERTPLQLQLIDGTALGGCLYWQDPEFLALKTSPEAPLLLMGRRAVALIRPLG
ncbi:hypothetical protein KQ302_05455 [Synechococcus sp. CS-602]|uniref:Hfq-related RNA-binding protein n=1 Tax=Synechococcaceae TaxID=1890426 RepID=UPI0008FF4901|nr:MULTISPECIES: hypothetical protein [Synechococcaceae]MCT4364250.1 hypothetical protein [Candidatus Regnicoccus frigidus MAG-AL1]APD48935.1 hypothetical protein BM449_12655 [Synechococcus sp. SynAce01]MCT0204554.1 hypothetical protein [Synechococcus sp. CS-602]MCT0246388.1 hypothetical protein [Synechococcus sp. CS-601]MCT4367104.1 hypothetical protein [Candidatus Regnicoccus frigidus MAG-AL2]